VETYSANHCAHQAQHRARLRVDRAALYATNPEDGSEQSDKTKGPVSKKKNKKNKNQIDQIDQIDQDEQNK
jgi:hypothetical protein